MQTTFEYLGFTTLSAFMGFVMSDATWAILIAQAALMIQAYLKDLRDERNRIQDRLDLESKAKIAQVALDAVALKADLREERIVNKIGEKTNPPVQDVRVVQPDTEPVPTKQV